MAQQSVVNRYYLHNAIRNLVIKDMGTGYIRFENGFQLCWGKVTFSSSGTTGGEGSKYESYAKAFNVKPRIVATPLDYAGSYFTVGVGAVGTSEFVMSYKNNHSYGADNIEMVYLAVGTWK